MRLTRVDEKGRILIPDDIRRLLGIEGLVKIEVVGSKLVIEALEDPVKRFAKLVVKGTTDVESEIRELRAAAEKEALKRVSERWP